MLSVTLGEWKNNGPCVATGGGSCGPGIQEQLRDCTDGIVVQSSETLEKAQTIVLCSAKDTKRSVSCAVAKTALDDCPKEPKPPTEPGKP